MNRAHATSDAWHPETRQDRDAILRELREVLASPHFCNSKRYPALLEYIVESTLAGKSDLLKERTLGVEVFGRPTDYDTNSDTVVRYTASEVRKRLLLYYSELDHVPAIRISLPAGSYVPEFLHEHEAPETGSAHPEALAVQDANVYAHTESSAETQETAAASAHPAAHGTPGHSAATVTPQPAAKPGRRRVIWGAAIVMAAIFAAAVTVSWWAYRSENPPNPVRDFWAPVLRGQHSVVICTGSVVFAPKNYSGVTTASRDMDYTFVSMQIASAITQIGGPVQRSGAETQLAFSASTPLTDLREHTIVLLGGYNNEWTLRLLQPLRFHFSPAGTESIVDQAQPRVVWKRDESLPYSSADDYALVARFRDSTIDGWVVALAGIGRNGTEAAADFATSPHYMQLLRNQVGKGFTTRNIEAVLKVNVIDGKTGAPSILAIYTW